MDIKQQLKEVEDFFMSAGKGAPEELDHAFELIDQDGDVEEIREILKKIYVIMQEVDPMFEFIRKFEHLFYAHKSALFICEEYLDLLSEGQSGVAKIKERRKKRSNEH